ncbi:hypothetical protein AAHA92_25349 [Salvia divinorum]|uniref:Uncharacterized protein n=1 Tax=Salvia divinorum TaxID=28513 RepID=A0ABD1GDJ6_SALDI
MLIAKSLIDDASSGIVDTYSAETANVNGKAEQMVAVKIMSQVSSFTYLGRNHYSNSGESILSVGCAAEESVGTKSVVQSTLNGARFIEQRRLIGMKLNGMGVGGCSVERPFRLREFRSQGDVARGE